MSIESADEGNGGTGEGKSLVVAGCLPQLARLQTLGGAHLAGFVSRFMLMCNVPRYDFHLRAYGASRTLCAPEQLPRPRFLGAVCLSGCATRDGQKNVVFPHVARDPAQEFPMRVISSASPHSFI